MSYTNIEQVRHHLPETGIVGQRIYDQKFILKNDDYLPFYSGAVEESSFFVKSLRADILERKTLTLQGGSNLVANGPLVPGSVVVASDSSLGTLYVENKDYSIDYTSGELLIKENGELSEGQTVTVWLARFTVYTAGVDFQLAAGRGEIRRLVSGGIASGEIVFLDYSPVNKSWNDDLLKNAVQEANGMVAREVDPERQFGADPALVSAATYKALAIICRVAAARELSMFQGSEKKALAWLQLGGEYTGLSDMLIKSFRTPFPRPKVPVKS